MTILTRKGNIALHIYYYKSAISEGLLRVEVWAM